MKTNVLFCGQTDAGKSTVLGHILYDHGYFEIREGFDESTDKSKYSRLLDTETDVIMVGKSKTTEFADFEMNRNGVSWSLVDTPGHQIYIRQLVERLFEFPVDVVCLIISSVPKEFDESINKGTVKEDLLLARSSGCSKLMIVRNKTDLFHNLISDVFKTEQISEKMVKDGVNIHGYTLQEMLSLEQQRQELEIGQIAQRLRFSRIDHIALSGWTGQGFDDFWTTLESIQSESTKPIIEKPAKQTLNKSARLKCRVSWQVSQQIISAGYTCILHCRHGEYEVEIGRIVKDKTVVQFLFNNTEPHIVYFNVCKDLANWSEECNRIVLRSMESTVGFGVIIDGR